MTMQPGHVFAGYTIIASQWADDVGSRYLVEHPHLHRREILTIAAGTSRGDQFTSRVQAVAALSHRSLVRIYNYGTEPDGTQWLTTQQIHGESLARRTPSLVEIGSIVSDIADAIDHVHSRGLSHGRIGQSTILLTDKQIGGGRVVIDGLADSATASAAPARSNDQADLADLARRLLIAASPTPVPETAEVVLRRGSALEPELRYPDCRAFAAELARTLPRQEPTRPAPTPLISTAPHPMPTPAQSAPTQLRITPTTSGAPRKSKRTIGLVVAISAAAVAVVVAGLVLWPSGTAKESSASGLSGVTAISVGSGAASGGTTACAVADRHAYCWGDNSNGQLGDGGTTRSTAPKRVDGVSAATDIATGFGQTCAVADGALLCWGRGFLVSSKTPSPIGGLSGVESVSISEKTICATATGTAYCWGGDDTPAPSPVAGLRQVTTLSTGAGTTCAIASGAPYCWGTNANGQVGDGTATTYTDHELNDSDRSSPTRVATLGTASTISTRGGTSCAVADGRAYCWGRNDSGQLGDGSTRHRSTPVELSGLSGVTSIETSGSNTCVVSGDGVYCWGANWAGQLGDGSTGDQRSPVKVDGLGTATAVSVGGDVTCAIVETRAECWGDNRSGALGDGSSSTSSSTPVTVIAP